MRYHPTPEPLHLAAYIDCSHPSLATATSYPISPGKWLLAHSIVFGRPLLHTSVLVEAAFATTHILYEPQTDHALLEV